MDIARNEVALQGPSGALRAPPGTWFERFGVTPERIRRVMATALSTGGDDCDLYFEHAVGTTVGLVDGKVDRATTHVDLGLGVRVRVGDQVGYAFTEDLSLPAMLEAARTAAGIARAGGGRPPVDLRVLDLPSYYPFERAWDAVGLAERLPLLRAWEADAFARDPRIHKVQTFLSDGVRTILVARPDGRLVQDVQPMTVAYVVCTAEEGEVRESASASFAARAGLEVHADGGAGRRMVDRATERTLFLLNAERPPAGEFPVVLAPGASGILLHEAIGHGMEADFNRKGISIFASRMGKRVAPPFVTIIDDGTVPGSRGAINTDDEGNPSERTVLVEEGVLRSYLHDEISAAHYGVAPTGSGRRQSFRHTPIPRMRATYMAPGPHDPEEIVRSVDRGIYCASFANGQVRIGAGDFAFYVKHGWMIEGGRLTRPIKDVNLIGNGPAALEAVEMVGNDLELDEGGWTCGKDGQGVPVSQGQPTVKVRSLVVGGVDR